jgi:hypothetical protein
MLRIVPLALLNPDYALGFVMRLVIAIKSCLPRRISGAVWRLSHSTAMVKSKTAMQYLILKQLRAAIELLMHISG